MSIQSDSVPEYSEIPNLYPELGAVKLHLHNRDDFLAAARTLVPQLTAYKQTTMALRRLDNRSVEALVASGILESLRPTLYGGPELDFSVMMEITSILAEGCAASAWVAMVYGMHTWFISMLPREGQDEIFGSNNVVLSPGVFNTIGAKARAVENGYMLSGQWRFASGSPHSNWACLSADVLVNGSNEARILVVPRDSYKVIDSWYALGLRGTGSGEIHITQEVFIPEHRTLSVQQAIEGTTPGASIHKGIAYHLPCVTAFNIGAAAPAIGITKAAIAHYKENIKSRTRAFTLAKQIENASAAIRLGQASIEVEMAELLLTHAIKELEETVGRNEQPSPELKSKIRIAAGYVPNICKKVITSLVEGSGAKAMFENSLLGTALQDATVLSTHHTLDYDGGPENFGRVLLGLEPSNTMI